MVVSGRAQQGGQSWVLRCFNVYADDCQMGDVFHDHQELDQLLENINTTLHLLQQFGLTINPAKCTALLTMGGTSHRKVRARCTTQTPLWIPIAATAKNLGTTIFYKHMEDHTVKHRLRLARIAFGRLQRWLTGPRGLKKSNRVQLFSTCVFPVLTWHFCKWHHATWPAEHPKTMFCMLRKILCNHACITGQMHQQALAQNRVALPLAWLLRALLSACRGPF